MRTRRVFAGGFLLGLALGFVVPGVWLLRRELSGYQPTHVLTAPLDLADSYAFRRIAEFPEHGERVATAPMIGRVEAGTRYTVLHQIAGIQYLYFFTAVEARTLEPISRPVGAIDPNY